MDDDGNINNNQVSSAHISGTVCAGDLARPYHENMMMLDNFTASDLEVEDIAGEILAAQFLRQSNEYGLAAASIADATTASTGGSHIEEVDGENQSGMSHSNNGEEAMMGGMETWFDNAWANDGDVGIEDGEAATRILRDAIGEGGVECGA